jgi:hypothetical protein
MLRHSTIVGPVMLIDATVDEARAILGAMASVAAVGGEDRVTAADRASLFAAHHYVLRQAGTLDLGSLRRVTPTALAAIATRRSLAIEAAHMLTVMAFVDGSLDKAKISAVLGCAAALGIDEPYVEEIAAAAQGDVQRALADMSRRNLESITSEPWLQGDAMDWFLPYRGDRAEPALAERYRALGSLPAGTLGHAYWHQYQSNGYAFPGEPDALNEAFATPHDSVHVLSGYDTSPRGELLVSTFTAAMHPSRPMEGHILPVIFSWHLGIKINDVAGSALGALDPAEFWHAWARGAAMRQDLFAPDWDFWGCAAESLACCAGASASARRCKKPASQRDRVQTRHLLREPAGVGNERFARSVQISEGIISRESGSRFAENTPAAPLGRPLF